MSGNESAAAVSNHSDRTMRPVSGWLAAIVGLALVAGAGFLLFEQVTARLEDEPETNVSATVLMIALGAVGLVILRGLFVVQPNFAVVMTFFGSYRGTVRVNGLRWSLPFYRRQTVSLRLRTLDGGTLKVNDLDGNPIEISTVIAWRVSDTARALFGVERFEHFVAVQSEAAVRELASSFRYDSNDDRVVTLRGNSELILDTLSEKLRDRLAPAGVVVDEARINHLAYAPEIANAMLRRQQATAVIQARASIVEGAVDIANAALDRVTSQQAPLSPEQRTQILSGLLMVLCADQDPVPTIQVS